MGSNSSPERGTWYQRLLIIIFGLSIVAIGAEPIQKKHGGLVPFIKKQTTALAKELKGSTTGRAQRGDKASGVMKTYTLPNKGDKKTTGNGAAIAESGPTKKLDRLDSSDRKALNNLVDSL